MSNIHNTFRTFEEEVRLNSVNVQRPGDIVHAFGEFMVIPNQESTLELSYNLTNNSLDFNSWGNTNVQLA